MRAGRDKSVLSLRTLLGRFCDKSPTTAGPGVAQGYEASLRSMLSTMVMMLGGDAAQCWLAVVLALGSTTQLRRLVQLMLMTSRRR